jgi:hypothetical protein
MNNEWNSIETAPESGEFLVRGGTLEGELGLMGDFMDGIYTVAHVERGAIDKANFFICNSCGYASWINNPTEWKPI